MIINFLTTDISTASGGAVYDNNFYEILKGIYPKTNLYNDHYFIDKYKSGAGLLSFNKYYKESINELMKCDVLIMNSRLYTRMMFFDLRKIKKRHPATKLLVIHHHSNFMNNDGPKRWVHRYLEKRVLKAATELIVPNEYVIKQIRDDFNIKNIRYLPSSFQKREYNISKLDGRMLLFVGNIERRKGIIYGLKAFKHISASFPDYTFRIVGKYDNNDNYYKSLTKYVQDNQLQNKVVFEGRVDDERLSWLYENAELFIFPSLLEGYGWVMIEAMARGVPVVAFNNSAMPYTVKDGVNGVLVENRNDQKMAMKIASLLEDRKMVKKLQSGALETYMKVPDQNDLNIMTEEYIRSW